MHISRGGVRNVQGILQDRHVNDYGWVMPQSSSPILMGGEISKLQFIAGAKLLGENDWSGVT